MLRCHKAKQRRLQEWRAETNVNSHSGSGNNRRQPEKQIMTSTTNVDERLVQLRQLLESQEWMGGMTPETDAENLE
jgi:hypothetical protein